MKGERNDKEKRDAALARPQRNPKSVERGSLSALRIPHKAALRVRRESQQREVQARTRGQSESKEEHKKNDKCGRNGDENSA